MGEVYVQLIDGWYAYSTINVEICQLEFYNIFTPNGDGDNELFRIIGIQGYPNSTLHIFDRWGTLVYEDLNFLGAWDGKTSSGNELADGTYYFTLSVFYNEDVELEYEGDVRIQDSEPGKKKFVGTVTILR